MSRWAPERVLVAIKPWQRGLPLESQHASQLADALGARLMIASSVFDARVAGNEGRGDAAVPAGRARLIEAEHVELEKLAQSLRAWGTSVSTRAATARASRAPRARLRSIARGPRAQPLSLIHI